MIVRSAPAPMSNALSAHPIVYGPGRSASHPTCALPQRPDDVSHLLQLTPGPAHDVTTDHAGLVLLGKYAQHLGLIDRLHAVPIAQRTRTHTPQTKLIQFFVGILAGLDYLQDFNLAPHPLVTDQAVSASWQQEAFTHYSGVSRTLAAADKRHSPLSRRCSKRSHVHFLRGKSWPWCERVTADGRAFIQPPDVRVVAGAAWHDGIEPSPSLPVVAVNCYTSVTAMLQSADGSHRETTNGRGAALFRRPAPAAPPLARGRSSARHRSAPLA